VTGLIRSQGEGLKKENINVNGILPGADPTDICLPVKLDKLGINPTLPNNKIAEEEYILPAFEEILKN
jgi:NAD(P)-dependent dehydrogenase (short-subunit alcohol dehydrogenase family)